MAAHRTSLVARKKEKKKLKKTRTYHWRQIITGPTQVICGPTLLCDYANIKGILMNYRFTPGLFVEGSVFVRVCVCEILTQRHWLLYVTPDRPRCPLLSNVYAEIEISSDKNTMTCCVLSQKIATLTSIYAHPKNNASSLVWTQLAASFMQQFN